MLIFELLVLKVALTGYTVAMVTCYAKRMITTCSPLIVHLFESHQLITESSIGPYPAKYKC